MSHKFMLVPVLLPTLLTLVIFHLLMHGFRVSRETCQSNKGLVTILTGKRLFCFPTVLHCEVADQATPL